MRTLLALLSIAAAVTSAPAPAQPRDAARVFISGHSLTDLPMPADLAAVAASLGRTHQWNRQYMVGSSVRMRTRGPDAETGWAGYRMGYNRDGEGLDVIAELKQPRTVDGPYDVLLITEEHGLLGTLVWHDTVRHLRHYHDRFIDGNAQGQTYFYEPWLDVHDKADPQRWIAYEREASPVWQCIVARVNRSALASLVEQATRAPGVPGISGASVQETVGRLLADNVHLTRLGHYYMALVTYGSVYRRSPAGAWAPDGVTPQQAASLQKAAWEFVSAYAAQHRAPVFERCKEIAQRFTVPYWSYVRDAYWRRELGSLHAQVRWLKHVALWRWRFSRDSAENPFHFDAETDKAYWFPAP